MKRKAWFYVLFGMTLACMEMDTVEAQNDSPDAGSTKAAVPSESDIPKFETVTNTPVSGVVPPGDSIHNASLTTADLKEFADLTPAIQALIAHGLELTRLNLKYQYGSDDPQNGGMDCSGTVYYLLKQAGIKDVPRDSSGLYTWCWKNGHVQSVVSNNPDTFELDRLKPGDLLFWTGTYNIERDPPITHVMIYLGTNRQNGRRVMIGASEGRTYDGKPRYGVSVFDFKLQNGVRKQESGAIAVGESESRFIGYGSVPGL
jgi:cell wall-associated NlpC family hydrolase